MTKKYKTDPDFAAKLAAKLQENPNFMQEADDMLLGELISLYEDGKLNPKDKRGVQKILKREPRAREILSNIKAADAFSKSDAGKAWLKNLPERALSQRTKK